MVSLPENGTIRASVRPDRGREARASAWAFVFECFHRRNGKEAAHPAAPKDAERSSNAIGATEKYSG